MKKTTKLQARAATKTAPRSKAMASLVARFVKLSASDKELAPTAKEWAQVLDRETGLIWLAGYASFTRLPHAKAMEAAAAVNVGGHVWRAPTIKEQLSIVDYDRSAPAFDTSFFHGDSTWCWTSTPFAGSPSDYAWFVTFTYGYADYYYRNLQGLVRAVRVARASQ